MEKFDYKWGALSPSDPSRVPMKYFTQEEAEAHANRMNTSIETWEENKNGLWNKDYWKVKPKQWIVISL